jgi:hypothetical protein
VTFAAGGSAGVEGWARAENAAQRKSARMNVEINRPTDARRETILLVLVLTLILILILVFRNGSFRE